MLCVYLVSTDEFLYGHLYNMYGNTVELVSANSYTALMLYL